MHYCAYALLAGVKKSRGKFSMKKRKLFVCDEESLYAEKLYDYISSNCPDIYECMIVTGRDVLTERIIVDKPDILLVSEAFADLQNTFREIKQVVYLTKKRPILPDVPAIYKYSPVSVILDELMDLCTVTEAVPFDTKKKTGIIGIYTPVKRCFQTTFALTLGQILAKDKKTLYLNFESFSGFDILTGKTTKTDLMDLLYLSECDRDSFLYRIGSLTERFGNLEYIPPTRVYTAFAEITARQWQSLIDLLSEQTDYDYLILDLSEQVIGLLDILNRCDHIYTIVDSGKTASAKMAQYETLIGELHSGNIIKKTEKITIPVYKEIPAEYEMLIYSELASYVKKLIKQEN